ncbi:unnamed protein product [Macrosiphum euphorbiae]|uniref:Transposase domain-containing protein n=1 Tax=Macrosiphum euphorbiae TaxID=13131 RepID=A0AAV0XDJ7_9HEMI|nr:unnamed protein product [Macrosiphum euphorbiae]
MIKSYRSKRRKIADEISAINAYQPLLCTTNSSQLPQQSSDLNINITDNYLLNNEKTECLLEQHPLNIIIDSTIQNSILTNAAYNSIDSNEHDYNQSNNNNNSFNNDLFPLNNIINTPNNITYSNIPIDLKLKKWAIECNVPHVTINKLLSILKEENYLPLQKLPLDSRTLLQSGSSKTTNIDILTPGIYYHFGLKEGIKNSSLKFKLDSEIKVMVGVDGLPLSKSSSSQFWPILAYIYPHSNHVFPVGIYHGNEKPHDSNNYLDKFIHEAKNLILNGLQLENILYKVSIRAFCCDSPARSFVLKIKGHSGFSSCTRCFQSGEYLNNRTCFPYVERECRSRTHDGYVAMVQKQHHIREGITSNLIELPNFDIVKCFPLDYMHLVLLGVMRKLLHLWMHTGPLRVRLNGKKINDISRSLLSLKIYIPSEFSRKPRIVQDVSRWKATELRQFLLYTGPVVLKNVLSEECYDNFMSLNIAMIILLSKNQSNKIEYADKLLHYFVKSFQNIYGDHFVSYNIHGLLHIVNDYKQFGPLDSSSCFPFENHMKILKSALRKHHQPLQQIVRRYNENNCSIDTEIFPKTNKLKRNTHQQGPILNNFKYSSQFLFYKWSNFTIHIKRLADRFILTNKKEIVKVVNIAQLAEPKNKIIIIGYKFLNKVDFYNNPINSSKLDIWIVQDLSNVLQHWELTDIKSKMLILVHANKNIAMSILHSNVQ